MRELAIQAPLVGSWWVNKKDSNKRVCIEDSCYSIHNDQTIVFAKHDTGADHLQELNEFYRCWTPEKPESRPDPAQEPDKWWEGIKAQAELIDHACGQASSFYYEEDSVNRAIEQIAVLSSIIADLCDRIAALKA